MMINKIRHYSAPFMIIILIVTLNVQEVFCKDLFNGDVVEIIYDFTPMGDYPKMKLLNGKTSDIRTVYISRDWWYQEIFQETIGDHSLPILMLHSWDGETYRRYVKTVDPENKILPTFFIDKKINKTLWDVNPLLPVYGDLAESYALISTGIIDNDIARSFFYYENDKKCCYEGFIYQDNHMDGQPIVKIEKMRNQTIFATQTFENFNISFQNILFPQKIIISNPENPNLKHIYNIFSIKSLADFDKNDYLIEPTGDYASVSIANPRNDG